MSRFKALAERLLKAGIAPRHVRRTVRELEDHLDDLIAMQRSRGYDGDDADLRARALLGPDDELAAAVIANRRFRSWSARAPWLVFGLLPPALMTAGLVAFGIGLGLAGKPLHTTPLDPLPAWCGPFAAYVCQVANFSAGPLAAAILVLTASRQRLSGRWSALGAGLAALFSALTNLSIALPHGGHPGEVSVGMGTNLPMAIALSRFAVTALVALVVYFALKRPWRTV